MRVVNAFESRGTEQFLGFPMQKPGLDNRWPEDGQVGE